MVVKPQRRVPTQRAPASAPTAPTSPSRNIPSNTGNVVRPQRRVPTSNAPAVQQPVVQTPTRPVARTPQQSAPNTFGDL